MAREVGPPGSPTAVRRTEFDSDDEERLVLSDLITRVLDKGVVISGQVTISVADIDLIAVDLRVLITSIQTVITRAADADASR
jgi:gas vesicle structural protein